MVATVKVLPYGVPERVVMAAEDIAAGSPIIQVEGFATTDGGFNFVGVADGAGADCAGV